MTRSDQPPTSRVVLQTQQSVVSGKSGEGDMVDVRSTYQSSMPISSGGSEVATGTVQNLDAVELAAILSKCGIGTGAVAFLVSNQVVSCFVDLERRQEARQDHFCKWRTTSASDTDNVRDLGKVVGRGCLSSFHLRRQSKSVSYLIFD